MTKIYAERYHDISCGHRVVNQGGKCEHLHGHNYRIHFKVEATLDDKGMVLDFSVIKEQLCEWLEECWDHRTLIYDKDPWLSALITIDPSIVTVPFNPTAENIARYLLEMVGPMALHDHPNVKLVSVFVEETRKCSASAELCDSDD